MGVKKLQQSSFIVCSKLSQKKNEKFYKEKLKNFTMRVIIKTIPYYQRV